MKKIITLLFVVMMVLSGCSSNNTPAAGDSSVSEKTDESSSQNNNTESSAGNNNESNHTFVQIKESPDKYTAYIKDYVSRNCATVGYESMGGDRNDYVGRGYIHVAMITEDGTYIGVSDEELKNYYVVAQNLEPNTEVKYTYEKDSKGEEYDNLIEWKSIDEIVLKVKPVGSTEQTSDKGMTKINAAPDKYTSYVKDYVGRNLAMCGYISMAGDLRDYYGKGNLKLVIIANDGSYIDLSGENKIENLKEYVVVNQGVAPNTEIKFEYSKDSNGNEYNFTDWQSREEIELYVERIG